jgi:riboflavin biosynthesis pyrimidine reductase
VLTVRQLLPEPVEIDPVAAHATAHRPAPADRPWVLLNMVASVDGATALDGVSGGLGGPADKVVFAAIRAAADVILVAAGTARDEMYGPPRTSAANQAARVARGQSAFPRLALVTRSLDLDPASAMFAEAPEPPLVFTVAGAPQERRDALAAVAEVVTVGHDGVEPTALLADLHRRGHRSVLVEGGPSFNAQLVAAGLVDEVNLSLSPMLVGGTSARLAQGGTERPTDLVWAHLWEAEGLLFARYVRR